MSLERDIDQGWVEPRSFSWWHASAVVGATLVSRDCSGQDQVWLTWEVCRTNTVLFCICPSFPKCEYPFVWTRQRPMKNDEGHRRVPQLSLAPFDLWWFVGRGWRFKGHWGIECRAEIYNLTPLVRRDNIPALCCNARISHDTTRVLYQCAQDPPF